MWIRSARWDGVLILGSLPLGVVLIFLALFLPAFVSICGPTSGISAMIPRLRCDPIDRTYALIGIYAIVLLDLAHTLSPICLAWTNRGFRAVMLERPRKFIVIPLILLVGGALIGVASLRWFPDFHPFADAALHPLDVMTPHVSNPLWWFLVVYLFWNSYHFAKQNFGILTIYGIRSGASYPRNQRRLDMGFCYTVQAAVMGTVLILPFIRGGPLLTIVHLAYIAVVVGLLLLVMRDAVIAGKYWTPRVIFGASQALCLLMPGMMVLAGNGINHWLVAIGLSSHVDSNANRRSPVVFVITVIVLGVMLFWALFWKSGTAWSWNLRAMTDFALPYVGVRIALGMVHFLYDRYVWRLSDPRVRTTIGAALFA